MNNYITIFIIIFMSLSVIYQYHRILVLKTELLTEKIIRKQVEMYCDFWEDKYMNKVMSIDNGLDEDKKKVEIHNAIIDIKTINREFDKKLKSGEIFKYL